MLKEFFPLAINEGEFDDGERLDAWLGKKFSEYSRSFWTGLIGDSKILVNQKLIKGSYKIKAGDSISWTKEFLETVHLKKTINLENPSFVGNEPTILKESDHWLVLSKPVGLTVHPGRGKSVENTLVGWLLHNKKVDAASVEQWGQDILDEERPGIVHRLDQDTSGVMIVAKNIKTHAKLAKQFETRKAGRYYHALIRGRFQNLLKARPREVQAKLQEVPCTIAFKMNKNGEGTLATYLARDPKNRLRFHVSGASGKMAITHFKELQHKGDFSWIELRLETGRTHQIRVHLSFLGFSIIGDKLYWGENSTRMWLHAHTLYFEDPETGKKTKVTAPLPKEDMQYLQSHFKIKLK